MVGAGKAHYFWPARVVTGQAHGLHHRLGARHVEGHLVHARNLAQALYVVQDAGVVRAQHQAQGLRHGGALGHAGFVKVRAKQVDAIGAGDVDKALAIQVGQPHAAALAPEAAKLDVLGQQLPKLVRHAVLADELQVRKHGPHSVALRQGLRALVFEAAAKTGQGKAAALLYRQRCAIDRKPGLVGVGVVGNQFGHALGHAQVAAQRWVFGHRQLQPLPRLGKGQIAQRGHASPNRCRHECFRTVHNLNPLIKPCLYDFKVKK